MDAAAPARPPEDERRLPREARSLVEKAYGANTTARFLRGCAGDIRPNPPGEPTGAATRPTSGGAVDKGAARKVLDDRYALMRGTFRRAPLALNAAYASWGEDALWARLGWQRPRKP